MKFLNKCLSLIFILGLSSCSEKHIKPSSYFTKSLLNKSNNQANINITNDLFISNSKKFNLSSFKIINHKILKDTLFFINEKGFLSAFNLDTKKILWSKNTLNVSFNIHQAGLIINNNKIYITHDKYLFQLDLNGNLINYTNLLDISFVDPVIKNDIIYVKTVYNLLALNKFTLETINKASIKLDANYLFSGDILKLEFLNNNQLLQGLYNGSIIISDMNLNFIESIYSPPINILNKNQNTNTKFNISGFNTSPIIFNDKIYIANNIEGLFCINKDGKILNHKKIEDIVQIAASNNIIYILSNANQISALSADNLEVIWNKNLNLYNDNIKNKIPDFEIFSNIIIYQNSLIFTAEKSKKIYILNLNGNNFIYQDPNNKIKNININFNTFKIKENLIELFIYNNELYSLDNKNLYLLNIYNQNKK
ncbi:MAG: hypothetical protein U1E31_01740 [Rickettsiales bacterium]